MCIRDSFGSVFTFSLTLLDKILLISGAFTRAETGSISTFPDFSGKIINVAITCEEYSPSAVSYTHLDVYKRQTIYTKIVFKIIPTIILTT